MQEIIVGPAPWKDAVRSRDIGYYLIYCEPRIVNGQPIIDVLITLKSQTKLLMISHGYSDALRELNEQGFEAVGPESRVPKFEEPAAWQEAMIVSTGVGLQVPAAFIVRLDVTERCPWYDQVPGVENLKAMPPVPPLAAWAHRKVIEAVDDPTFLLPVRWGASVAELLTTLMEQNQRTARFVTFSQIAEQCTLYDLVQRRGIEEENGTALRDLFAKMGLDLRVT